MSDFDTELKQYLRFYLCRKYLLNPTEQPDCYFLNDRKKDTFVRQF